MRFLSGVLSFMRAVIFNYQWLFHIVDLEWQTGNLKFLICRCNGVRDLHHRVDGISC